MDGQFEPDWDDPTDGLIGGWDPFGTRGSESPTRPAPHSDDGPEPLPQAFLPGGISADFSFGHPARDRGPLPEGPTREAPFIGSGRPPVEVPEPAPFPRPGEQLAGFRLLAELGRGAFARVYLAEQINLFGRPVALKVARALGDEPQSLSRLQHAHIVPIHSIHDDPVTGLRLMCMPYLGGANLAQVLESAGAEPPSKQTGVSLVHAIDRVDARLVSRSGVSVRSGNLASRPARSAATHASATSRIGRFLDRLASRDSSRSDSLGVEEPSRTRSETTEDAATVAIEDAAELEAEPARRFFLTHTYIQSAVWIATRLAEALEHAHARGVLHRDLKPSNVLIASDGTPMLLDFNLSADVTAPAGASRAMLGGTLPYMAPEHLDAFNPEGTTPASAVDERSDVYSLGLILYEMVAGTHPFPDPGTNRPLPDSLRQMIERRRLGAPSARSVNPSVSRSLDSILATSLAPDPVDRYQRAHDFAEDLRRFLDDRQLLFAPEPSLAERASKWLRRHPEARSSTTIGLLSAVLMIALGLTGWMVSRRLEATTATVLRARFENAYRECQVLLNASVNHGNHIDRGLLALRNALGIYHVDDPPSWQDQPAVTHLSPAARDQLAEQVAELMLLQVRATLALASGKRSDRLQALRWASDRLDRAEAIDPHPSPVLYAERAAIREALGMVEGADKDRVRAAQIPLKSARDLELSGTALAAKGELDRAEALLNKAISIDNRRFWAWFALGLIHYDQGRYDEAAGDFAVCSVLVPPFAWPWMNRGLALARAGRLDEADQAYSTALVQNLNFVEAYVNRGLERLESGDAKGAAADFAEAEALGRKDPAVRLGHAEALHRLGRDDEARLLFDDALVLAPNDPDALVARGFARLVGDPAGAADDFAHALRVRPGDPRALLGQAHLLRPDEPTKALERLDLSLRRDPGLHDARQLRALIRARLGDVSAVEDVDRLLLVPTRDHLYNAACALSILGSKTGDDRFLQRALGLLRRALDTGLDPSLLPSDPDLAPLRDLPEFRSLSGADPSRPHARVP